MNGPTARALAIAAMEVLSICCTLGERYALWSRFRVSPPLTRARYITQFHCILSSLSRNEAECNP